MYVWSNIRTLPAYRNTRNDYHVNAVGEEAKILMNLLFQNKEIICLPYRLVFILEVI